MRDLAEVMADVADQDRGQWFDLVDPVTGEETRMRFRMAGPDSATQHRAQLALADELADLAGPDGRVSAAHREAARLRCLAACVLGWEIVQDGAAVPFSQANVIRVLKLAKWIHVQVDGFAADRAAFRSVA